MEIDLDLERSWLMAVGGVLVVLIVLLGLAGMGQQATPVTAVGVPRVMTWDDWQVLQLKRAHNKEIVVLGGHIDEISMLLELPPDPIAAQVLYGRVYGDVQNGLVSTAEARGATLMAADGALRWATGQLDRDEAILMTELAIGALK
ncbi:MAG: hypothetical protein QY332_10305 [Anaerolineales bacterium]|nr:MAG: hypothetical protein QY332_10305 [Anaerolineales bacterium]